MKKIIFLILTLALFFSFSAFAGDDIKIIIDGRELISDVPAILVNGRTMLPLRVILNGLSVPDEDITWWEMSETVEVKHDNIYIFMPTNVNTVIVNGVKYYLDSPAFVMEGRTMVPIRFLSEALNYVVEWNEAENTVLIRSRGE